MPTTPNVFQELQTALDEFKAYLTTNSAKIRAVVTALILLFPDITKLIDDLIGLLGKIKTAVNDLKLPGAIPNVGEITAFAEKVENLVIATRALVPTGDESTDEVLEALEFVAGIPGITSDVKDKIMERIGEVVDLLESLKTA